MKPMKLKHEALRFIFVALFILVIMGAAWLAGTLTSYSLADPFEDYYSLKTYQDVSSLVQDNPLDDYVTVTGQVSRTEQDYTSKKGYVYQQFYISDSQEEVKVFCSKYKASVDVKEGDTVTVTGKLQLYYQTLEIYTECQNVRVT